MNDVTEKTKLERTGVGTWLLKIPLPPEACWVHRFYNNMTAQEHGPWILTLGGFDQIVSSQDLIVLGDPKTKRYFLAGALSAERSTTHLLAHFEYGRFTRLMVWQPEAVASDQDPAEQLLLLEGTDWQELVETYWASALEQNGVRRTDSVPEPLTGYCPWYYYYDSLSEAQLLANVAAADASQDVYPCRIIQIDDGYQSFHGDWLELNDRWPTLFAKTIKGILESGFEVGVWIMPFLAAAQSRVAREHPSWFVKGDDDQPVYVRGWSAAPNDRWQCLDVTHPEAINYIRRVFLEFRAMGVTYFKLDGVGFSGQRGRRRDAEASGSSAFRLGLRAIREAAGDCLLLGCGGNYLAGLGVYDTIRVSCDTAINYEPRGLPNDPENASQLLLRHPHPSLPSLENAVRATLYNWWRFDAGYRCDPDVIVARDNCCNLTEEEARISTLSAILTGIAFTSDKLDECATERLALLALAARVRMCAVRPLRVEEDGLLEVFGGNVRGESAVAFFNFSNQPKYYPKMLLPESGAAYADLLNCEVRPLHEGERLEVPAHGAALIVGETQARQIRAEIDLAIDIRNNGKH